MPVSERINSLQRTPPETSMSARALFNKVVQQYGVSEPQLVSEIAHGVESEQNCGKYFLA